MSEEKIEAQEEPLWHGGEGGKVDLWLQQWGLYHNKEATGGEEDFQRRKEGGEGWKIQKKEDKGVKKEGKK